MCIPKKTISVHYSCAVAQAESKAGIPHPPPGCHRFRFFRASFFPGSLQSEADSFPSSRPRASRYAASCCLQRKRDVTLLDG